MQMITCNNMEGCHLNPILKDMKGEEALVSVF